MLSTHKVTSYFTEWDEITSSLPCLTILTTTYILKTALLVSFKKFTYIMFGSDYGFIYLCTACVRVGMYILNTYINPFSICSSCRDVYVEDLFSIMIQQSCTVLGIHIYMKSVRVHLGSYFTLVGIYSYGFEHWELREKRQVDFDLKLN